MEHTDNEKIAAEFAEKIQSSITSGKFIKLTLSKALGEDQPQNIYAKLIQTKKGILLSCTLRYPNKDITQNLIPGEDLKKQLSDWIGKIFKIATLISESEESVLQFNNKNQAQIRSKVIKAALPEIKTQNKEKNYLIKEDAAFLKLLGVSSKEGRVFSDQQDKYRQINKYCEIMLAQMEQQKLLDKRENPLQIVDMGSGKGYLTFALYQLLQVQMGLDVEILGVELRENLCEFCNQQAKVLGWENGLKFAAMDILNYNEGDIDVLIALHACDTATDIAIAQGIKNEASLIVVAPCCHKQIRKEIHPKGPWKEVLKNGILMERQAELITDALRALLLEHSGYRTKVFEFISTEHTAKNLMITAGKLKNMPAEALCTEIKENINALKDNFGIQEHFLERLLKR